MEQQEEINLLEYYEILKKGRKTSVLITIAGTLLAVVISLIIPKTYKSEAILMPVGGQKGGGLAAAAAQMGLGGLLGGLGGDSQNTAQIMAIFKSRTIAEKVIEKDNLLPILFPGKWDESSKSWKAEPPTMEDAVKKFRGMVDFVEDKKNQTIVVSAEFKAPKIAMDVADDLIKELYQHISNHTFTSSKRNRIFVEGQLERNKAELLDAGKELAAFYTDNKISNSMPLVDVDVSINPHAEASNKDQGQPTMDDLEKQLEDVNRQMDDVKVVKAVPQQVYLQYLTLRHELLGKVNALLTQQYELAKVEENKDDLTFQVIDPPNLPIRKYKPKRVQIVVTSFILSGLLSMFYVLFRGYVGKLKASGSEA